MKPLDLPIVIAHRGAAAYAPENTIASFREAKKRGATWVEFDVKLSADNRLVIMHDSSLKRPAGLDALVAATTYENLRKLDAGSWFGPSCRGERVPDFEETIGLLRGSLPATIRLDLHLTAPTGMLFLRNRMGLFFPNTLH